MSARLEDATFLADNGETLAGAAARMGLTVSTLRRWLQRNAPEVRATFSARERPSE